MLTMMTKKLLFSMLLLFVGVNIQAQSVANKQMDEKFNDGTHRYFDLQGRMLDGMPDKGVFIIDNKKVVR